MINDPKIEERKILIGRISYTALGAQIPPPYSESHEIFKISYATKKNLKYCMKTINLNKF